MAEQRILQINNHASGPLNVKDILLKYLKYWYWFLLGIVICFSLAYVYLKHATPEYKIRSTLLIKNNENNTDLSGNTVFSDMENFKTTKNIDNEIEILKSRSLMQRVISELSFYIDYSIEDGLRDREIYGDELPIKVIVSHLDSTQLIDPKTIEITIKDHNSYDLKEDESLSSFKFGQEIQKPYGTFTVVTTSNVHHSLALDKIKITFYNIQSLAGSYKEALNIELVNKNASVLAISITSPVKEKGIDLINKLVDVYNQEAIEDKNSIASSTLQFIDERLAYLSLELSDVEKSVEQYKQENEVTNVDSDIKIYLEKANTYKTKLIEFETQIEVLKSIEDYLNKQHEQYKLVPSTLAIQDPTLLDLITKFNELQLDRGRLLQTTPANNPLVQNLSDQLANLKGNIVENVRNITNGLAISRNNLKATSYQFESKIQQVPATERRLLEIDRQQNIKENLYLYLLQKREESALTLAATNTSNIRIIDPAIAELFPVKPKKALVFAVALLIGLGLPFIGIYIKDIFSNDKVQQKNDILEETKTPILGEIMHSPSKQMFVVSEKSRMPIAESFHLVSSNLFISSIGRENKVILVTSSMSGEGKTFFTMNLGASIGMTGKKIAIINFDLRKQNLGQNPKNLGLTDYLSSENYSFNEIITSVQGASNLYIVHPGIVPINPIEVMMHKRVEKLIHDLRRSFDYILIDTPPVGQVADAFALASLSDSTIYIVRNNYTYKAQLDIINDIYINNKFNHPMIVLNDMKAENKYGYAYVQKEKSFFNLNRA